MEEFPLARLGEAIAAKRRQFLTLLLVGAIAGALWGSFRPRWYSADVTLAVRRTAALDAAETRPDSADYPTLLANRAVARDIASKHQLQRWDIDAAQLLELVRIREVRNTSLLVLTVTMPEPELARAVASSFAARAIELNRDINARDVVRARDMIEAQLGAARAQLRQAEQRLLDHRSSAQVEVRRADSKAKLDARTDLVELSSDLEAERSRLGTLERQLKAAPTMAADVRAPGAEQELVEQSREFDLPAADRPPRRNDSDRNDSGRNDSGRNDSGSTPPWPRAEGGANPVRQLLDYQVAASRARLAAMEGRLRDLTGRHDVDSKVMPDLLALYEGEVQLTRFELEREIAARAVTDLSAQYEQARLKVASRVTDLQVVDEPIAPTRPVTSGTVVSALTGLLLALVGCVLMLVPAVVKAVVAGDARAM